MCQILKYYPKMRISKKFARHRRHIHRHCLGQFGKLPSAVAYERLKQILSLSKLEIIFIRLVYEHFQRPFILIFVLLPLDIEKYLVGILLAMIILDDFSNSAYIINPIKSQCSENYQLPNNYLIFLYSHWLIYLHSQGSTRKWLLSQKNA